MKKDKEEEEHWPRITKEKVKLQWLQTDWSRFVDEDEEDGADSEMSALPRPPPLRLRRPHTAASERRALVAGRHGRRRAGIWRALPARSALLDLVHRKDSFDLDQRWLGQGGMGGMPGMGGMGGMPGMGGPGGMDMESLMAQMGGGGAGGPGGPGGMDMSSMMAAMGGAGGMPGGEGGGDDDEADSDDELPDLDDPDDDGDADDVD